MENESYLDDHIHWIDAAKAIAILAVIVDHLHGIVYSSNAIQLCSFFSVTLFVCLGGIHPICLIKSMKVKA